MCGLHVSEGRVGLHTICQPCEVTSLYLAIRLGNAPWRVDEATLTEWFNARQASEAVREGLQQAQPTFEWPEDFYGYTG